MTARWSTRQPFLSEAFSNTSVGTGLVTDRRSVMTSTLKLNSTALNCARWSFPVYEAAYSDPTWTIVDDNGRSFTLQIPDTAAAAEGTDQHMSIVQPDRRTDFEMWGARKTSSGWDARYVVKTDLLSSGMTGGARASAISHLHGLIRTEEVAALHIPHTLAMGIGNNQLKSGYVWPARSQDGDGVNAYTGTIPMGTMFVIPRTVDIDSLGLSPEGRALAWTLQNYGAHVLLRAGPAALFAETEAEAKYPAKIDAMRSAWVALRPLMEVVTNNTADNVAGGGARLQPTLGEVVAK